MAPERPRVDNKQDHKRDGTIDVVEKNRQSAKTGSRFYDEASRQDRSDVNQEGCRTSKGCTPARTNKGSD